LTPSSATGDAGKRYRVGGSKWSITLACAFDAGTKVPAALATIRFVKDGSTFAPLDLVLPSRTERHGV
jgi:hypothetical protein